MPKLCNIKLLRVGHYDFENKDIDKIVHSAK